MPLKNFGAVLNFAAEMEAADKLFYQAAAQKAELGDLKPVFAELAKNCKKNEANMLRARRENVTEMILEPISDFERGPFVCDRDCADSTEPKLWLAKADELETKAIAFYTQAAEKIKALPEVSRALKTAAKLRRKNQAKLAELSQT